MNDICIPLPKIGDQQVAEVEVTVNGKKKRYHFRVEAFPWEPESYADESINEIGLTELKIIRLRTLLNKYDKGWELIQIYNPRPGAKYIHVLFRQRTAELTQRATA